MPQVWRRAVATMDDMLIRPSGFARHVSADGCQFVLDRGVLKRGQKIAFRLDGIGTIRGDVRWTVGNRVGFAFDRRLAYDVQNALQSHSKAVRHMQFEITG